MNLANDVRARVITNYTAAGTTTIGSTLVDMNGFEGALFVSVLGSISASATPSVKIRGADSSDGSDLADLAGTKVDFADDDDNQAAIIDVYRPRHRYLEVHHTRTGTCAISAGVVLLYGAKQTPTTNDASTVVSRETHVSPAEGTA